MGATIVPLNVESKNSVSLKPTDTRVTCVSNRCNKWECVILRPRVHQERLDVPKNSCHLLDKAVLYFLF